MSKEEFYGNHQRIILCLNMTFLFLVSGRISPTEAIPFSVSQDKDSKRMRPLLSFGRSSSSITIAGVLSQI